MALAGDARKLTIAYTKSVMVIIIWCYWYCRCFQHQSDLFCIFDTVLILIIESRSSVCPKTENNVLELSSETCSCSASRKYDPYQRSLGKKITMDFPICEGLVLIIISYCLSICSYVKIRLSSSRRGGSRFIKTIGEKDKYLFLWMFWINLAVLSQWLAHTFLNSWSIPYTANTTL